MKKYILFLLIVIVPLAVISQPLSVRKVFRKYGHKQGVVSVWVPGVVMDLAALFGDDPETRQLLRNIDKVRVLAIEDNAALNDVNFNREVKKTFINHSYEQLMLVKESGNAVDILVKEGLRDRKELLIIAGGKDDNAIIYLKGKLTPEMLGKLGKEIKIDALSTVY